MLNFISGFAVLGITEWLLLTAWLSQSRLSWQYTFWVLVVVLLWGQPWSRRDPYRTGNQIIRWLVYFLLLMESMGSSYIFDALWPLLLAIEVGILVAFEFTGLRSLRRE
jgi:hypothetical protein